MPITFEDFEKEHGHLAHKGCCMAPYVNGVVHHRPGCFMVGYSEKDREDAELYEKWRLVPNKPRPDVECESMEGWIAPDGTYYGCGYGAHIALAQALKHHGMIQTEHDPSRYLEQVGWVRPVLAAGLFLYHRERGEATQRQIDTVFKHAQRHHTDDADWLHAANEFIRRYGPDAIAQEASS